MKYYNYTAIKMNSNINMQSGPIIGYDKADVINYWTNRGYTMVSLIELTEEEHKKIDENNRRKNNDSVAHKT